MSHLTATDASTYLLMYRYNSVAELSPYYVSGEIMPNLGTLQYLRAEDYPGLAWVWDNDDDTIFDVSS